MFVNIFFKRVEKYVNDTTHNILYFALKHASIFVLGDYLFLEAHSFLRASLSENCSHLGTDNRQLSVHSFAPNTGYCLFEHEARLLYQVLLCIPSIFYLTHINLVMPLYISLQRLVQIFSQPAAVVISAVPLS